MSSRIGMVSDSNGAQLERCRVESSCVMEKHQIAILLKCFSPVSRMIPQIPSGTPHLFHPPFQPRFPQLGLHTTQDRLCTHLHPPS